ncbi:MAG: fibronectin type III domain-containing protein [Chloroflexota bacterium]|nr:fibronectin type III domain-containing protein [Chloroflexota bacterium]
MRARGDGTTWSAEWSNWSNTYKATNGSPPAPSPPYLNYRDTSSLTIQFGTVSGSAKYQVRHRLYGVANAFWTESLVKDNKSSFTTTHLITGLDDGTKYEIQARAFGDGKSYASNAPSPWSSSGTTTTVAEPDPPKISSSSGGKNSVTINWTHPNAQKFRVDMKRRGSDSAYHTVDDEIPGSVTTFIITGEQGGLSFLCGTSYNFRVFASESQSGPHVWSKPAQTSTKTSGCGRSGTEPWYRTHKLVPLEVDTTWRHKWTPSYTASGHRENDFTEHSNTPMLSRYTWWSVHNLTFEEEWVRSKIRVGGTDVVDLDEDDFELSGLYQGGPDVLHWGGVNTDSSSSKYRESSSTGASVTVSMGFNARASKFDSKPFSDTFTKTLW